MCARARRATCSEYHSLNSRAVAITRDKSTAFDANGLELASRLTAEFESIEHQACIE
jgi:hypothetical protein